MKDELVELRKDAERYRKLRALHWTQFPKVIVAEFAHLDLRVGTMTYSGDRLDELLDGLP